MTIIIVEDSRVSLTHIDCKISETHTAVTTAANPHSPWAPGSLISHASHAPHQEAQPQHITAVSPVTLVTLVENRSKGTFGLAFPPNDASSSLHALFSSHCRHSSSEPPFTMGARLIYQSRRSHITAATRDGSPRQHVFNHPAACEPHGPAPK